MRLSAIIRAQHALKVWGVLLSALIVTLAATGTASARTQNTQTIPWWSAGDSGGYADVFALWNDQGLLTSDTLELYGPAQQTSIGDPVSPFYLVTGGNPNPWYTEQNGVYTYRIAIPPDYPYDQVRIELFDPQTGNTATLPATIWQTDGGSKTTGITCAARTEPCVLSTTIASDTDPANPLWFVRLDENRTNGGIPPTYPGAGLNTRTLFRLYYYQPTASGPLSQVDLAYYIGKKDESGQATLSAQGWFAAQSGSASQTEATATMNQWVSPGAPSNERMPAFTAGQIVNGVSTLIASAAEPATVIEECAGIHAASTGQGLKLPLTTPNSFGAVAVAPSGTTCAGDGNFIVDLNSETQNIYVDPATGMRYLSLDVIAMDGSSENNFAIWAGPAITSTTSAIVPAEVNARQLFINRQNNASHTMHASQGLKVYAMGRLPRNSLSAMRYTAPLANLGPDYAALPITVSVFDQDAGALGPVIFYMEGIPRTTWEACFTSSGGCTGTPLGPDGVPSNNAWVDYTFTLPSASSPTNFTGGRLMMVSQTGALDTFNVKVTKASGTPVPAAPALSSPLDGHELNTWPDFSWLASANAGAYQLQIASDAGFSSLVYSSPDLYGLTATPPAPPTGDYYWRVRARRILGGWGSWSAPRTFTLAVTPDLVVPPESFTISGVPPNPTPNTDVTFHAAALNQGQVATQEDSTLRLYGNLGAPLLEPVSPTVLFGLDGLGETTLGHPLAAGALSDPLVITAQFPSAGVWYVYAFVDADNDIDEARFGLPSYEPAREENNVTGPIVVTVTSESDLVLTKTVSNPAPATGTNVTYTLTLKNQGTSPATNVALTDVLPSGVTYVSSSPASGTYSSGTGQWTIPSLAAGATTTLAITAQVTAPTGTSITNTVTALTMDPSTTDPDHSNDMSCTNGCRSATLTVGAINLSIVKSTVGVPVAGLKPGSANTFQYKMVVTNTSTVTTATNVKVLDTLPTGIHYVATAISPGGAGACPGTSVIICTIPTLAPGAAVTVTFTVYANTGTGGQTITNTATTSANEIDPDTSNNSSSTSVTVQSADIEVTNTASQLYVAENNTFTWTVKAKNLGPNPVSNLTIMDVVPAASLTPAITYTVSGGTTWNSVTKIWTIGSLAVNATATLTITAFPKTGTVGTTITNNASLATLDLDDVNPANNAAAASIQVNNANAADLQLTKSVSPSTTGPGSTLVYTFVAKNNGPINATGVVVTDTSLINNIGAGHLFIYGGTPPAAWNTSTGKWTVGTLNAGQSTTLQINVLLGGDSITSQVVNTAVVTATTPVTDLVPSNNTATATLNIAYQRAISISPATSYDFGGQVPGTSSSPVTFTVTNTGVEAFAIGPVSFSGDPDFIRSNNTCTGASVNPGATCTFKVKFSPGSAGFKSGSLTITNGTVNGSHSLLVTGLGAVPVVTMSAASHPFGTVLSGTSTSPFGFTLTNTGAAPLHTGTLSKTGSADFALSANTCDNQTIAPSGTCSFNITFSPASNGLKSGSVSIPSDASTNPDSVSFNGTGAQPAVSLSASSHDFGDVSQTDPSGASFTVTVTNTGGVALHVGALGTTGSADFSLGADACSNATVAVSGTCSFDVIFAPTTLGAISGGVSIPSDAPGSPHGVTLSGNGAVPGISLSATSHDFGSTVIGQPGLPFTFTLTSTGTVPLRIAALDNGGSSDFTVMADTCTGAAVAASDTCTFDIQFSPSSTGPLSAQVSVESDAPGSPHIISLSGTGTQPALSLSASSHDFGNVVLGGSGGPFTFTVTNTGTAMLNIDTISKTGSADFTISNDQCSGAIVANAGSCTFDITFSPTTTGSHTGQISIPSNAPSSPDSVSLSGSGVQPALSLSVSSHDFGNTAVSTSSGTFTFTVTSTGTAALHIGTLNKTGSADFTLSNNTCDSATVAVSGTCSFDVTFSPSAIGAKSGGVSIPSDAPTTPDSVSLSGAGTAEADLRLTKTVDTVAPAHDSNVHYTISLNNLGGATAQSINLTDLLPAGLQFVSSTTPGGSTYTSSTGVWFIPSLAASQTATLVITAKVTASNGTIITNTVSSITMNPYINDPDRTNDTSCTNGCKQATIVVGALDLSFSKTADDNTPDAGQTVAYTLAVNNPSAGNATGVTITDTLPAGVSFSSASSGCSNSSGTVTCTVGSLAAGASTSKTINVTVNSGTEGQTIGNTATVSASQIDVDLSNNISATSITVNTPNQPTLSLSASSHDFGIVALNGSSNPFTFTVTSTGTAPLHIGTLNKTGSADFTLSNNTCTGATVAVSGTCSFDITFSPSSTGAKSGSVSIPSDALTTPDSVTFTGTGTQSALSLSATSHNFGPVVMGTSSAPFTITVTNTGSVALNVSALNVSGDFAVSNSTCGSAVSVGGTCTFDVTFSAITPGAKTGSVSVVSDASSSPDSINLSGTGLTTKTPPVLSAPKNGAAVYKTPVKLSWKAAKKPLTGYVVELDDDANFSSPIPLGPDPAKNTITTPALDFGIYYWHVAVKDASGQGAYSATFSFEVTLNKTPKKNATLKNGVVKFAWQKVTGISSYKLQVFTNLLDPDGSLAFPVVTQSNTSYPVPKASPLPSGTYYWRVSIDGGATWTLPWMFSVP